MANVDPKEKRKKKAKKDDTSTSSSSSSDSTSEDEQLASAGYSSGSLSSDAAAAAAAGPSSGSSSSGSTNKQSSVIKGYFYSMQGHAEKCVEKYCELAGVAASSLKRVATPSLTDHQIPADDFKIKGKLSSVNSRIVLKILFFARIARPDCLGACNQLSREVSRWTAACDKRLFHLISYINDTKDWVIKCMVGDPVDQLRLAVY